MVALQLPFVKEPCFFLTESSGNLSYYMWCRYRCIDTVPPILLHVVPLPMHRYSPTYSLPHVIPLPMHRYSPTYDTTVITCVSTFTSMTGVDLRLELISNSFRDRTWMPMWFFLTSTSRVSYRRHSQHAIKVIPIAVKIQSIDITSTWRWGIFQSLYPLEDSHHQRQHSHLQPSLEPNETSINLPEVFKPKFNYYWTELQKKFSEVGTPLYNV